MRLERITIEPDKMGGVPCVRGMRVPAATIVGMVAEGMTADEIPEAYPYLERDDVRAALEYAAEAVAEWELPRVNPDQFADDLGAGAVVVIGDNGIRVQRLAVEP